MRNILLLVLGLFFFNHVVSQEDFSNDPLNAKFITEDYERFWTAFSKIGATSENPFHIYIENASEGLKPFAPYLHPDSIYKTVVERKGDYLKSKDLLVGLPGKKKRLQAIYTAMKYWYPEAKFPPVYFVVGIFTSGGTVTDGGLLIGTELMQNLDGLPGLAAHELIHYQQNIKGKDNLLKQSLIEGSADFIGELISGEHINKVPFEYGNKNEDKLCKEFVELMEGDDYLDWLYGTSGKDNRPNDLGYWIGYKICEAYFYKQENKELAIKSILEIQDPIVFLKESGYLAKYYPEVVKD